MNHPIDLPRRRFLFGGAALVGGGVLTGFSGWIPARPRSGPSNQPSGRVTIVVFDAHGKRLGERTVDHVVKTSVQWRAALTPAQYHILREAGTEPPGSGQYVDPPEQSGIYRCQGCGNALYDSATQFHSGTGWPSFWQPIADENVTEHRDGVRTEIRCALCDGHLGHKFHDGPPPTGLRYCMDSLALRFVVVGSA